MTPRPSLIVRLTRWILFAVLAAGVVNSGVHWLGTPVAEAAQATAANSATNSDGADADHNEDGQADDKAGEGADEKESGPLLSLPNLITLVMLTLLQAVLGFDNLLYISIESKRVPADQQAYVRRLGIGIAIGLRIVLLFVVMGAIKYFQKPFFVVPESMHRYLEGSFNVHSVIVIAGGVFIMYTAIKEISHMLAIDNLEHEDGSGQRSIASAVFWIVLMNLVFSFDSILSALALTNVFVVMAAAIIISGLLMIYLSDRVAVFLEKNRMYEVLGLFILFIVGVMLLSEGGHLAHLHFFTYVVEPMAKSSFYFTLAVLVVIDIVQSRYQKKLNARRAAQRARVKHA